MRRFTEALLLFRSRRGGRAEDDPPAQGAGDSTAHEVELAAADGTSVNRSGSLNNGDLRRLDIPVGRFRSKVARLTVRSELPEGQAAAYLHVAEPRLQSATLDPENTFVVRPDADIYLDERFTHP